MNLEEYKDNDILLVVPNKTKMNLLKNNHILMNIKYMDLEEYKSHYFFSYDNKTIDYLINKYHYNIDICKIILNNLYVIDINKNYNSNKLNLLQEIKIDLINSNYLYFDKLFSNFIKNKKVIVYNYNTLDKYLLNMFNDATIIKDDIRNINTIVVKCRTLEDEVIYVVEEVLKLYNKGIDLSKIYISNVSSEYLFLISKIFSYYNIPINIDMNESIYGTSIVKNYLNTGKLPGFSNKIVKKLIDVVNSLIDVSDSSNYKLFLEDSLKSTNITSSKYKNSINIFSSIDKVMDDEYLFIMGFNQDVLPKIYKDEDYISDSIKDEVDLFKTTIKNKLERENIIRIISNTKNIFLSYKEKSSFSEYLPSSIISDLSLNVESFNPSVTNSDVYNKLLLGQDLDSFYMYNEKSSNLISLISHYNIDYNTYDNSFTGINKNDFLDFIKRYLKLSYTSLNNYNLCGFKYYINYILKIDPFKSNFSTVIGNLFHYIFSVMNQDEFNFNREWNNYINNLELTFKEKFFLNNLKKDLEEDIRIIKDQDILTRFNNKLYEKEVNIKFDQEIDVCFTGKIDKIMSLNNNGEDLVSIIDYKTGSITTNINNMKYGIGMQLPIYLYLISKSNLFSNPKYTGIYLQKVLFPSYSFELSKTIDMQRQDNLKLQGYSTDNLERLSYFDKTYLKSELIKGMKLLKDGSISSTSKVLNDVDFNNILDYTEKEISKGISKIIDADFSINPKVIDNTNIACTYCKYRDVCFKSNKNLVYLDKVSNLDFLGGEDNGE